MEKRFCSNCGNRLEPDARFCSNCGMPVYRDVSPPEADAPTSQLPTWQPPTSQLPPLPQDQPHQVRGGIAWHSAAEVRGGISWPMLALAALLFLIS